jgi:16S rRNA (guanine527-N7)-methyltransferase
MTESDSRGLTDVSRETTQILDSYLDILRRWQKTHNLVAHSTLPALWTRHVTDSCRLWPVARRVWLRGAAVDIGSGAGFPGIVLAVLAQSEPLAERGPIHLVESNGKKAAFLRHVAQSLKLDVEVHLGRIEDVVPTLGGSQPVDLVTARALSGLTKLLEFSEPLLKAGATGLFPKGTRFQVEVDQASRYWTFNLELAAEADARSPRAARVADDTDRGPILVVRDLQRRTGQLD